ncbi:MAG: hypothetical protein HPY89_06775 [Pelotomaculum sp.]|nr:hypothetical protein [Pelotomaculum sp.]
MKREWYVWPEHLTLEQVIACCREQLGKSPEEIYKKSWFWWTGIKAESPENRDGEARQK